VRAGRGDDYRRFSGGRQAQVLPGKTLTRLYSVLHRRTPQALPVGNGMAQFDQAHAETRRPGRTFATCRLVLIVSVRALKPDD